MISMVLHIRHKVFLLILTSTITIISRRQCCRRDQRNKDDKLDDIGHDLTPNLENNETVLKLNNIIKPILILIIAVYSRSVTKLVNLLLLVAIPQLIRPLFYLSTRLPSSNDVCYNNTDPAICSISVPYLKGSRGCGDLRWSGHMMTLILCILFIMHHKIIHPRYNPLLFILIPFQTLTMLSTRSHYTVDTLLAILIAPLIFFFVKHSNHPIIKSLAMLD
jgi:hypothetical protein